VRPPERPLVLFDGDCGFCRQWIERWRRVTGDAVDYAPYQAEADRFPQIPRDRLAEAVHLIEPDGRVTSGAEAVFRALATAHGRSWLLSVYEDVPGVAPVSEACYRLVARHRPFFTRVTGWIWGRHVVPPGETATAWLFLRALGVIYGIAFASLWVQLPGLVGRHGILPAGQLLAGLRAQIGLERYWLAPTLAWFGAGDGALAALAAAGVALAVMLTIGFAPRLCLIGLWGLYLSLATVCREFLWFQWDGLLLETGFLAIFLAPSGWWSRPSAARPPPRGALWLLRWLLFRLMFSSAVVKLASGDPTWRHLTALDYHYGTQPLPPWTAWYAAHLPAWFQHVSTAGVLVIEGLVPFLIPAPRRIRFAGAGVLASLQVLILLTGNYAFFNWLALALCLLLLDDGVWPRAVRERFSGRAGAEVGRVGPEVGRVFGSWVARPVLLVLFLLSLVPLLGAFGGRPIGMGPLEVAYRATLPFRVVNYYGLFAVMTTERPEIILEGSADGRGWKPYEFRYKPGDVTRRPAFVAPHQPRLDWQMWFAALGRVEGNPWFLSFCQRLLEGSRPVLALLETDPFPRAPPRYLRAIIYEYRFTDAATRRATGAWWRRERRGFYCPVLTLRGGRLVAAEPPP
jgi:predicted DCC family thiol-disulfide oxidoreductase YuxK